MVGVYKILSTDDNFTTLENLQEIQEMKGGSKILYGNGMLSGLRYKKIIKIPSNKITIGKEIEDGYFEVKITYGVYKENQKDLAIRKLNPELFKIRDMFHTPIITKEPEPIKEPELIKEPTKPLIPRYFYHHFKRRRY